MKFICENCKAKYQIGDDKIAGRSVRMKCRRCGHTIQLSASVTSGDAGPASEAAGTTESSVVTSHEVLEQSASDNSQAMRLQELLAAQANDDLFDEGPTRAMTMEQRLAGSKPAAAAPAPAAAPTPAAPPAAAASPSAARPAFSASRPVPTPPATTPTGSRPATSPTTGGARPLAAAAPALGATRPAATPAPSVATPTRPAATPAPGAARPAGRAPTLPPVRSPAAAGVTGAFQKAATGGAAAALETPKPPSGAAGASHVPHGEDWYVGVAGVPLGPVRLAVIREKALTGAVHAESLVWREGFDEWAPLKGFPELLQIVEEAQAARAAGAKRPSVLPPPTRPSAVPPPPTRPSAMPPPSKPPGVALPPVAKPPLAPAGFQPKATVQGLGMPAVTVPGKAPAPAPARPNRPSRSARRRLPQRRPPPGSRRGPTASRQRVGASEPGSRRPRCRVRARASPTSSQT